MPNTIKKLEHQLIEKRGISKLWTMIKMFTVLIAYSLHRAFSLLFQSSQKSFAMLNEQNGRGIWTGSYLQHQRYQRQMRMFSLSGFAVLVLGVAMVFSGSQLLYPNGVSTASAATSTFTVTNGNDSGAGSLRQAIASCGAVGDNDCVIQLNNESTVTLALESTLEIDRKITFQNMGADTDMVIDGSDLGPGVLSGTCLSIDAGGAAVSIEGVEFRSCVTGVAVRSSNVQIGTGSSAAGRVYVTNSGRAVSVQDASNITVQNVYYGKQYDGTANLGSHTNPGFFFMAPFSATSNITLSDISIFGDVNNTHPGAPVIDISTSGSGGSISNLNISDLFFTDFTATALVTVQGVSSGSISGMTTTNTGSNTVASLILDGTSNFTVTGSTFDTTVAVQGSYSNVRIGASSLASIASEGNSIQGGVHVYKSATSGFDVAYNTVLSGSESRLINYPYLNFKTQIFNLQASEETGQITGATTGTPGTIYVYQNGTYLGEKDIEDNVFTITNAELSAGDLMNGAQLDVFHVEGATQTTGISTDRIVGPDDSGDGGNGDSPIDLDLSVTTTSDSAQFSFDTTEYNILSEVYIGETQQQASESATVRGSSTGIGSQQITIDELTPGTTYYYSFRISSVEDEDEGLQDYEVYTGSFTTEEGDDEDGEGEDDIDIGLQITNVTTTTATFGFNTGPFTITPKVYLGSSQAAANAATTPHTTGSAGAGAQTLTAAGLTPDTTYFYSFRIYLSDEQPDVVVGTGSFTTDEDPVVTNPTVSPTITTTTTTARFQFSSSQVLKPKVYVAQRSEDLLSDTPTEGEYGVSHDLLVGELVPDTQYHYVIYVNLQGNGSTYTEASAGQFRTDSAAQVVDLDDDYLQKHASVGKEGDHWVENQVVYDPSTKLYLGPDDVNLVLENATKGHDIKFEVENEDGDIEKSVDWKSVTKNTIQQKFADLRQGVVYIIRAKVRKSDDTNKEDTLKKVTTIEKTDRDRPAYTTYSGHVTVTAEPILEMGGDLEGLAGRVVLQDVYTGKTVSSCYIPRGESLCSLVPRPPLGDYRVQFATMKGSKPGAPDQMLLTIADRAATSVLYADRNNPAFMRRIVTNNQIIVAGASTTDVDIILYLDGKEVKFLNREEKTDVGWQHTLSLNGVSKGSHILRVVEKRRGGSGKHKSRLDIPFVYTDVVAPIEIQGLRAAYYPNTNATIRLVGSENHVTSVYVNDLFLTNVTLAPIGSGRGAGSVSLPTNTLGFKRIGFETRNELGLRGAMQTRSYSVIPYPAPGGNTNTNTNTGNNTNTGDEDNANSNTNTDNNTNANTNSSTNTNANTGNETNTNGSVNNNTNTNTGEEVNNNTNTSDNTNTDAQPTTDPTETPTEFQSPVPFEQLPESVKAFLESDLTTAGSIIIDSSVVNLAGIPSEYRTEITDPVERERVEQELLARTKDGFTVQPYREIEDLRTGAFTTEFITPEIEDAISVFPQKETIGLPSLFERKRESYGIQLTGTALPYALVKATIRSTPIVKITRADGEGKWTMTVPADALDSGKHTAYLQAQTRGVSTDNVEIANFVIVENQKLSNTTWIVIINLAVAGIILILVLGMQLGKHRQMANGVSVSAYTKTRSPKKKSKKRGGDHNEPPSTHNALGV